MTIGILAVNFVRKGGIINTYILEMNDTHACAKGKTHKHQGTPLGCPREAVGQVRASESAAGAIAQSVASSAQ